MVRSMKQPLLGRHTCVMCAAPERAARLRAASVRAARRAQTAPQLAQRLVQMGAGLAAPLVASGATSACCQNHMLRRSLILHVGQPPGHMRTHRLAPAGRSIA